MNSPIARWRWSISLREAFLSLTVAATLVGWYMQREKCRRLESRFEPLIRAIENVSDGEAMFQIGSFNENGSDVAISIQYEVEFHGQRITESGAETSAAAAKVFFDLRLAHAA